MSDWIAVTEQLPEEQVDVTIRVRGAVRSRYYRIEDRWYGRDDLNRWVMKTSRYWAKDRAWYLETEQVTGWRSEPPPR